MNCHLHIDVAAIGICKICGRGICPSCARPSERAISCSAECETQAILLDTMNQQALKIYGVGAASKQAWPTNAVMPAIMGLGFLAWSAYDFFTVRTIMSGYMGFMGALFLFGAWFGWRKYREHGLNV